MDVAILPSKPCQGQCDGPKVDEVTIIVNIFGILKFFFMAALTALAARIAATDGPLKLTTPDR